MSKKITKALINEIAQDVQMSDMEVYLHKQTLEIVSVPSDDVINFIDDEDDLWANKIDEVNENIDDYIHFTKIDSHDSFQIMEDFVEEIVSDKNMKNIIYNALRQSKPFRRFKDIVEVSSYREDWFAFQQQRYEDHIRTIIEEEMGGESSDN